MDNAQQKLIENLKKQLESRKNEIADRQYVYAIQQVVDGIVNKPKKPLTFISGSTIIEDIDSIEYLSNKYTPYLV